MASAEWSADSGAPVTPLLPDARPPLRVAALVSGAGRNLGYLVELAAQRPDLVQVAVAAAENPWVPALGLARRAGVPAIAGRFNEKCGRWSECTTDQLKRRYGELAAEFHDELLIKLQELEANEGQIDLVVLAYTRWIHGRFLEYFDGRIINQHPGDLTELTAGGQRAFAGPFPIEYAVREGRRRTRTTTFLVDHSHDGGAILCQGPWLDWPEDQPYSRIAAERHEERQASISDRPALHWVVTALAEKRLALSRAERAADGSARVCLDGVGLPFGGYDLANRKMQG